MVVIIIGREITVLGFAISRRRKDLRFRFGAGEDQDGLAGDCRVRCDLRRETRSCDCRGEILVWLVVLSALASAVQYFQQFWSQVDGRVKEGRRLRLLERRAKTQDAPTTL